MEEMKVVLHFRDGHAMVGVQQKDTDPMWELVPGQTLEEVLGAVPGVVGRARERWATTPRNPKYDGPPPPPRPSPAPTPTRASGPQAGQMQPLL